MLKIINSYLKQDNFYPLIFKWLILLIAIIISAIVIWQSVFYRWFGYETKPTPITDEYDYAWQALSLKKYGLPVAWSTLSHIYRDSKYDSRGGSINGFGVESDGKLINIWEFKKDSRPVIAVKELDYLKGKEHMFFIAPFFEHPPLGGMIYSLGVKKDVKEFEQVKADAFRRPALVMAIIVSVLLFILLYLLTLNPFISTLGVIIYSTVPTYLLSTRTAFLENAVAPFILAHLILLYLGFQAYQKNFRKSLVYLLVILSGLIGGLSVLAKETAIGFILGSIVLLLINKLPKKFLAAFLFAPLFPILGYITWGLWLQGELFIGVFFANASRGYFGALKLVTILETLNFKNFPIDGWWFFGLFSFIYVSAGVKDKRVYFFIIPAIFHFLTILFMGSENYPWYFLSMIPFFAGFSALLIWKIYENPTVATSLVFFLIPFSSSYYWGRVALNLSPSIDHYRWSFLIFIFFLGLRLIFHKKRLARFIWFVFLAILIQKIIIYNQVFMPYLMAHWGNLPIPSLPGF